MYKDKNKQKEANRLAQKRFKDKQKGITSEGYCSQGITTFEQLPRDVQLSIVRLSDSPEEKAIRTSIAIAYQNKMGKRPNTGIDCYIPKNSAKPGEDDYHASGIEEHCGCGEVLPQLEQPRQYPGRCLPCVTKGAA